MRIAEIMVSKIKITLPLFLLAGIIVRQYYFDLKKSEHKNLPTISIPAEVIKLTNLGLHSASSALLWLNAIQQISTDFREIPKLIKNINDTDSKFSYPYAFATLILPSFGLESEAIKIAEMGIKEADPDWRIPYYLATAYHIFLEDRANASLYFDMAASTPGAPENIKTISARYGTAETTLEQTKNIWIAIYETSDDEIVTERAQNYILHIEIVQALEKAISIYRQDFGIYPTTIENLVTKKILKEIPKSPLGVKFGIKNNKLFIE